MGIGALRRLEVLALHNNQLERLEKGALQHLNHLQVLTLANNKLTDLSDVSVSFVLQSGWEGYHVWGS